MSRSALIIVDVQLGMYNGERIAPIFQGEEKIERISRLLKSAREKGLVVIYVRHIGGVGHPLEQSTGGFETHPKISPRDDDLIIEKRTPDSFLNTSLKELLEDQNILNIYVAGNQTDFCIDTTCRSAWAKGFNVVLVSDCHSTWDSGNLHASQIIDHHNSILGDGFVQAISSNQITFTEFGGS
ncbi:MAG: cysteine hydrolase family protein [Bacteroidota bacterium]